jgi:hypothetical protein
MTIPPEEHPESSPAMEKDPVPVITRRTFRQLTAPKRQEEDSGAEAQAQEGETMSPGNAEPQADSTANPRRRYKFMPAFWTVVSIFSLLVNVILVVVLVSIMGQIFTLKTVINNQLVAGLDSNFQLMDQARIKTTINISTKVPAKFDLPLDTDTNVTLTKDTTIKNAKVTLSTGGLQIVNAPANIILPAGTVLPVHLDLSVPVDQQIPVNLTVPVDIPLSQTDLHKPFSGLSGVVQPYRTLLDTLPGSWQELMCGQKPSDLCKSLVP